jgi:hypothetical protein
MMKMMLSGKIQEALDKVVDGLVDASNGKMPEGSTLTNGRNRFFASLRMTGKE